LPHTASTAPRIGPLRNGNPRGNPNAAPRCGARTRQATPCRSPAMRNGRCRMHGGCSTGPRTEEGLARVTAARTIHGGCSAETRAFFAYVKELLARGRAFAEIAEHHPMPYRPMQMLRLFGPPPFPTAERIRLAAAARKAKRARTDLPQRSPCTVRNAPTQMLRPLGPPRFQTAERMRTVAARRGAKRAQGKLARRSPCTVRNAPPPSDLIQHPADALRQIVAPVGLQQHRHIRPIGTWAMDIRIPRRHQRLQPTPDGPRLADEVETAHAAWHHHIAEQQINPLAIADYVHG
jgi:hypothetical protein